MQDQIIVSRIIASMVTQQSVKRFIVYDLSNQRCEDRSTILLCIVL